MGSSWLIKVEYLIYAPYYSDCLHSTSKGSSQHRNLHGILLAHGSISSLGPDGSQYKETSNSSFDLHSCGRTDKKRHAKSKILSELDSFYQRRFCRVCRVIQENISSPKLMQCKTETNRTHRSQIISESLKPTLPSNDMFHHTTYIV